MSINRDKPDTWENDISISVDYYNKWFMKFAPKAFRDTRTKTTKQVEQALAWTKNLTDIKPEVLAAHPEILPMLRMSTCPPIARDRLIGLAGISQNLVYKMENDKIVPPQMKQPILFDNFRKIGFIINRMTDPDIFPWIERGDRGNKTEIYRASTIVADRLCGSLSDPIIRNAQEQRQLKKIRIWLEKHGYKYINPLLSHRIMRKEKNAINFPSLFYVEFAKTA